MVFEPLCTGSEMALGGVKAYNLKFLGLIFTRLDAALGLRHVNVLEAQAEEHVMGRLAREAPTPSPKIISVSGT